MQLYLFYRLVEEIKDKLKITVQNEDLFMATTFKEFSEAVVLKSRGKTGKTKIQHSTIKQYINNMDVSFPNQLFINGEFVDSESGEVLDSVNPSDESLICQVKLKYFYVLSIYISVCMQYLS
jgi:formyltetrahydrofolate dehydrogenase